MDNLYHQWSFKILEDGSMEFLDPSKPDRFFMKEGDLFKCGYKNNKTVLVKIKDTNEDRT